MNGMPQGKLKDCKDISLYYQILPHSHMILSASRIRIIGWERIWEMVRSC